MAEEPPRRSYTIKYVCMYCRQANSIQRHFVQSITLGQAYLQMVTTKIVKFPLHIYKRFVLLVLLKTLVLEEGKASGITADKCYSENRDRSR